MRVINVALPKGRLGERVCRLFEKSGLSIPGILEPGRKLIFEREFAELNFALRLFWVKPFDVPVYVERGAADIGISAKDILLEREPDVYELLDLKTGICTMSVAALENFADDNSRTLRVATEFPNIARKYYAGLGRDIDIICLRGSVELAPILNLSDVIVDIVETGTTLRENNLRVINNIANLSARLIANKSAYKFKTQEINNIIGKLRT